MRFFTVLTAFFLCTAALSGCTSSGATTPPQATGDAPEETAARTAYAKIKAVYGNEITVVLADGRATNREAQPQDDVGASERSSVPPGERGEESGDIERQRSSASGRPDRNNMPSGGQSGLQSGSQLPALSFTGEEHTYLIGPSVAITSGSGEDAQAIRFTQLSEKAVVQLSFDQQNNLTAIAVLQ